MPIVVSLSYYLLTLQCCCWSCWTDCRQMSVRWCHRPTSVTTVWCYCLIVHWIANNTKHILRVTNPHSYEPLQYMIKKTSITEGKQQPTVQTATRLWELLRTSPKHNITQRVFLVWQATLFNPVHQKITKLMAKSFQLKMEHRIPHNTKHLIIDWDTKRACHFKHVAQVVPVIVSIFRITDLLAVTTTTNVRSSS